MYGSKCGHKQKMYYGAIFCIFYTICVLVAYKFQFFFRQVSNFVRDGTLPTESTKRRNTIVLTLIGVFTIVDWALFAIINQYYTDHQRFELLWKFNFGEAVIISIMLIIASTLLCINFRRLGKLVRTMDTPHNHKTLSKYKFANGAALLSILVVLGDSMLGLYTQGFYGPLAVTQQILSTVCITICELIMFTIIFKYNMDLKLQTQVLHNGEIVLLGID